MRFFLLLFMLILAAPVQAQTPAATVTDGSGTTLLQVNTDAGFVVRGLPGTGAIPATGAGTRLMWYPRKSAFRAGYVNNAQWDDANVGTFSAAMGAATTANGAASFAMGTQTTASGNSAIAMGSGTTAIGNGAIAMGSGTTASGAVAVAMGYETTASGFYSTAMGYVTTASGYYATAIGHSATASGVASTALGNYVSTSGRVGSFMLGDYSTTTILEASAANQLSARFAGGYRFYTNSVMSTGVQLPANANAWSVFSDSTKKERFLAVDGEQVLSGTKGLRLGTWNYKGQREPHLRHYGPMAQEFYAAFGRDAYGTIGSDTLLATADVDGVLFIAAQALERRTAELDQRLAQVERLQAENEALRAELAAVRERQSALDARLAALEAALARPSELPAVLTAAPARAPAAGVAIAARAPLR